MRLRMGMKETQSMDMIYRSKEGTQLWLGDYVAACNLKLLKQKNICSVLTSAAMLDINYAKEHEISHKIINAYDVPSYKMTPHFEEAFIFIEESLKKGNILVHCSAGISRSPTFVIAYLMKAENMRFQDALQYVQSKRSIVCPNYGFQKELQLYQIALKHNFSTKQQKEEEKESIFDNHEVKKTLFVNEKCQKQTEIQLSFDQKGNKNHVSQCCLDQKTENHQEVAIPTIENTGLERQSQ